MVSRRKQSERAAVICFTESGIRIAGQIRQALEDTGFTAEIWCKKQNLSAEQSKVLMLSGSLRDWTGERFSDSGLLVFVGAAGIAVRAIAPFLVSKASDPAVLAVDEQGKFVISLVSGHLGGANDAASVVAAHLHAVPVITTATDLNGRFAVDVFAKHNDLLITDLKLAKQISARILDGETITVCCDLPVDGPVPDQLRLSARAAEAEWNVEETDFTETDVPDADIYIGFRDSERIREKSGMLRLIPEILTVGMGCRKNTDAAAAEAFFEDCMRRFHLSKQAVSGLCSIDLKAGEPALLALAAKLDVPFDTYTAQQLAACPGAFSGSEFVSSITGVDNVCERSAVMGSGGHLLVRKQAGEGITMAVACRNGRIRFE